MRTHTGCNPAAYMTGAPLAGVHTLSVRGCFSHYYAHAINFMLHSHVAAIDTHTNH